MIVGGGAHLNERQASVISTTERVTSVFSLLGLTFIFTTFIFSPRFRKPINRLMFYAAFGDAIYNIATLMARAGVEAGEHSSLCQFQGFVIEMFLLSDTLWNLSMAINVWLTVFKKYDASQLRGIEWIYMITNYGVPFVIALTLVFIETEERGKMYGNALLWCWISIKWDYMRIALLYAPAWVLIFSIVVIYIVAGAEIFKKHRALRDFSSSDNNNHSSGRRSAGPVESFKTTEVHVSTELADLASPGKPEHSSKLSPRDANAPRPYSQYNVTIGRGDDVEAGTGTKNLSRPQKRALTERNTAAWAYTKAAVLFFIALLITWLPSSINRVYSLIHPNTTNWPLNLAAAIVLPLMGFWNTIIYIVTSWSAVKALVADLLPSRGESHGRPNLRIRAASPPWTMVGRGRSGKGGNESSSENLPASAADTGGLQGKSRSPPDSILELERTR